jgi:cytochrome P450
MHRDASLFPSPDTFLPDRWLETPQNRDELLRMNQHLMPFGTGSRICGGQNFAQVMLRVAVATIVRNFDIVAPPETNERTMEMRDSFVRTVVYTLFTSDRADN